MRTNWHSRRSRARQQLAFLKEDIRSATNFRRRGFLTCWLHARTRAVIVYRLDRAGHLLAPEVWRWARLLAGPVAAVLRPAGIDIRREADIGPGLQISHVALGVVVSRHARIGARAVFTGGNCVGIRREFEPRDRLTLGDDLNLGVNAVVLGPVRIGHRVRIGAGAVAVSDAPDDSVITGSPARARPAAYDPRRP